MSNQQNIDVFFQVFTRQVEEVQQRLPTIIGVEVLNQTTENFQKESFEGEKWPARKDKKNKKKLLVKNGHLWRSPRIVSSTVNRIEFGSDLPYAEIQNNGGKINRAARSELFVRNRHKSGRLGKMFGGMGAFKRGTTPGRGMTFKAYTITIPARKFLGVGPKLRKKIEDIIKDEFKAKFK